jgi:ribulose 1,5-bisphosphate synthetase/thiazole synthase
MCGASATLLTGLRRKDMKTDVIIVGGGSAGAVLAARLSADYGAAGTEFAYGSR